MMGQLGETRDIANGNGDVKANIVLNDYFREKSGDLRNGFCSKKCVNRKCNTKISLLESLESELEETQEIANGNGDFKASNEEYGDDSDEQECHEEDEEVDVMALRKLVRIERQKANAAYLELEKERLAAATAAEEAMAMILKLQNDKSLIEMEANQYRRLTEEKQLHDQEVIHSLRWIVMKHESERGLLEDQLRFFRQKLKLSMEGYEGDQSEGIHESLSFFNSNIEDSPGGDALISSLDMDLSTYRTNLESTLHTRFFTFSWLGVGCGVGLGFGYGMGRGISYDDSQRYSNVGKFFKGKASLSSNLPSQDEIGALIDELVMNTKTLIKANSTQVDEWRRFPLERQQSRSSGRYTLPELMQTGLPLERPTSRSSGTHTIPLEHPIPRSSVQHYTGNTGWVKFPLERQNPRSSGQVKIWATSFGYSHGVLVARGAYAPSQCYLWDPLKRGCPQLFLPLWDTNNVPFQYAALSSSPEDWENCVMMVLTGISHPAFAFYVLRKRNLGWSKQDCNLVDPHSLNQQQFMQFTIAIVFRGKFCALSLQGTLAVLEIDIESNLRVADLSTSRAVPSAPSKHFKEHLIESNGEILLVFLISRKSMNIVEDVEIKEYDINSNHFRAVVDSSLYPNRRGALWGLAERRTGGGGGGEAGGGGGGRGGWGWGWGWG
ncbi:hypothetical protein HYC85_024436 [Camellia sinensis]|uniref:GTD-binding domain-containing protein n=1 Tax=Camellia sinensis TaxID=4442 RepID=A0A7J7G838_CAMSI|nr:hypothetical protein HYC85_024436 [Camellia sinensis]